MLEGRGFFPPDKEIFRSHTDVWQGKATPYGDRGPAKTEFSWGEEEGMERA